MLTRYAKLVYKFYFTDFSTYADLIEFPWILDPPPILDPQYYYYNINHAMILYTLYMFILAVLYILLQN